MNYEIVINKLKELPNPTHPNNIEVGYQRVGILSEANFRQPKIGERFYVDYYWSTSVVTEIIDDNTFKTLNSIYKWYKNEKK